MKVQFTTGKQTSSVLTGIFIKMGSFLGVLSRLDPLEMLRNTGAFSLWLRSFERMWTQQHSDIEQKNQDRIEEVVSAQFHMNTGCRVRMQYEGNTQTENKSFFFRDKAKWCRCESPLASCSSNKLDVYYHWWHEKKWKKMRLFQVREKNNVLLWLHHWCHLGFRTKQRKKILQILPSLIHIVPSELHDSRDRL